MLWAYLSTRATWIGPAITGFVELLEVYSSLLRSAAVEEKSYANSLSFSLHWRRLQPAVGQLPTIRSISWFNHNRGACARCERFS